MDTKLLVNPHKIRSSIKRLFAGKVTEILSELLQNSQRAGANRVDITTAVDKTSFTYRDNGCGLQGVEGFYKILSLGDSGFDESVIENQEPMGVGFGSLLAHESISKVRITSNGLTLEIDTKRWWDEQSYYSEWESRLSKCDLSQGFYVDAECEPQVIDEVRKALPSVVPSQKYWIEKIKSFPALGYKDILEISLDGVQVQTGAIDDNLRNEIVTHWIDGNKLTIYSPDTYRWHKIQVVNWYGQLIGCDLSNVPFRFVFEVRNSRPINPKAPVRAGFIEDKAFELFRSKVEDVIFSELCSLQTVHATPENIKALYKMNAERANRECPYITAAPLVPYEPGENEEWECEKGEEKVFLKENSPLLIKHAVKVIGSGESCYYGVSSFVGQITTRIAEPYELTCDSTKPVKYLVWNPGKPLENRAELNWFRARGEFCLSDDKPTTEVDWHPSDVQWHPVEKDVFAFPESNNWDIESVQWAIGCEDPIKAVKELGYAGFNPYHDEHDTDELRISYDESMDNLIWRLSPPPPIDAIAGNSKKEILEHIGKRLAQPERTECIRNVVVTFSDEDPQSMIITGKRFTTDAEKESFYLVARVYE